MHHSGAITHIAFEQIRPCSKPIWTGWVWIGVSECHWGIAPPFRYTFSLYGLFWSFFRQSDERKQSVPPQNQTIYGNFLRTFLQLWFLLFLSSGPVGLFRLPARGDGIRPSTLSTFFFDCSLFHHCALIFTFLGSFSTHFSIATKRLTQSLYARFVSWHYSIPEEVFW